MFHFSNKTRTKLKSLFKSKTENSFTFLTSVKIQHFSLLYRDLSNESLANLTHKSTKQHQFPMQGKENSEVNLGEGQEIT